MGAGSPGDLEVLSDLIGGQTAKTPKTVKRTQIDIMDPSMAHPEQTMPPYKALRGRRSVPFSLF